MGSAIDSLVKSVSNSPAKPGTAAAPKSAIDALANLPAPKQAPAEASSHYLNPLNPNYNKNVEAGKRTLFDHISDVADSVAEGAVTVGGKLGLQSLLDIPAAARDYVAHPEGPDVGALDVLQATGTVTKQVAQGAIALPADITIGTYEAATNQEPLGPVQTPFGTFQSPQSTQKQLQDAGYGTFVSALGAIGNEVLNSAAMVGTAVALDDIFQSTAAKAGTRIATEKLTGELTPDELRAKLANGEIKTPAGRAVAEKYIAANETLKVDLSKPASEIRRFAGENLLGGEAQTGGTVKGIPQGEPIAGRLGPEPFSNETPAPKTSEPFNNEPGKIDGTLEPFTGALKDQLPDRVLQIVSSKGGASGGFLTIPIAQAHSIIDSIDGSQNGVAGKNINGQVYHITAKSPSQMEALGFKNLGVADSNNPEAGFVDPGQALKDIQETIQKFKDNTENAKAGERLRTKFVGNKNARIVQTNQLLDSLKNIVKDPVEQEALSLARDFSSNPNELAQFLYGEHPFYQELTDKFVKDNPNATPKEVKLFKQNAIANVGKFRLVIEKALSPTESMTAVNEALDTYYGAKLEEGRKEGVLDSSIDPKQYITHILTPQKLSLANRVSGGRLGKKFVNAQERHYPTQLHAIANGLMPKTLNAFTQTTIYEDRHATAVATAQYLKQLKAEGLLKLSSSNAPKDFEAVKVGRQLVFMPKNMADAIKPLLEESGTPNSIITGLKWYQGIVKAAEVSLSVFHMKALAITSINADGIPTAAKEIMTNMNTPEFKEQEMDFVKHGGTTSELGKTIEAYKLATKSSIPTRTQLLKQLPVLKQVISLADKITHATFDVLQREAKVVSYSTKVAAWLGKHPNATPEEVYNAKVDLAKVTNAFYGGLNWESLGIGKLTRSIAQALIFAPDWTWSNFLSAKYVFQSGPAGAAARRFWLSSIIFGLVATQMLSLAVSGKKSKHPFQTYFGTDKNGKEIYGNWFFVGAPGDLTKWLDNMHQYGAAVGTARTLGNKIQSIPRALVNLFTNKNYLGQSITIPGASPTVNTARGILQFGSDTLPIPFSLVDFAQMLSDKKQDYKLWDYLSLIGGTPPRHEVPQGSHVPTTGKNKGKVVPDSGKTKARPQKSMLEQIETGGSIYKPKKN